jgi:hypothetical protein
MKATELRKQHGELLNQTLKAIYNEMKAAARTFDFKDEENEDYIYELPSFIHIDKHGYADRYYVAGAALKEGHESWMDVVLFCYNGNSGDDAKFNMDEMELYDLIDLLWNIEIETGNH